MLPSFFDSVLQLVVRTSTDLPPDVRAFFDSEVQKLSSTGKTPQVQWIDDPRNGQATANPTSGDKQLYVWISGDVLVASPKLEQLLGPDILYTSSKINIKPAEIGSIVEWHQDMAYGPLTNSSVVAALVYLDDADLQNGCLQVIPGQSRMLDHSRDGFFQGRVTESIDTSKAVSIEGKKGTVVFFNGLAPHASSPNRSSRPRRTLILGYRAADAFPIYLGEMSSNVARFDMDRVFVPHYPRETKSLYELQELSHQQQAAQPA